MNMNQTADHSKGAWANWLVIAVFADLLFLPRLLFAFGIPVSLLLVLAFLIPRALPAQRMVCIFSLAAVLLSSVALGAWTGQNPEPMESFKRALQLISMLLFAFLQINALHVRSGFLRLLRAFYLYVFLLMLLFYSSSFDYEKLIYVFYPEAVESLGNNLEHLRFAYFFDDPNSAAYFLCFTLVAYLRLESRSFWKTTCTLMAVAVVASTQSRGGYMALFLVFAHFLLFSQASMRLKLGAFLIISFAAGFLVLNYWDEISLLFSIFEARFGQEEDLGGGRVGKYLFFLQNMNFLPVGQGYHLLRDGQLFRPHSDLIRLNMAYGFVALWIILYFVVPRTRNQVLLFLIFIIPFLINTVIDDYRLFPMYLLLLSIMARPGFSTKSTHSNER